MTPEQQCVEYVELWLQMVLDIATAFGVDPADLMEVPQ